jgi:hypothetical protein
MELINEFLSQAEVEGCFVAPLRRIFNNNLTRGGRLYAAEGAWQTMTKKERLKIRIANEPVVEVDYSTLHPALLYAEVGKYAPADAYVIDGWPRKLTKIALNTLINAPNIHSARLAIAHHAWVFLRSDYFTCSMSGSCHVLSNRACVGP